MDRFGSGCISFLLRAILRKIPFTNPFNAYNYCFAQLDNFITVCKSDSIHKRSDRHPVTICFLSRIDTLQVCQLSDSNLWLSAFPATIYQLGRKGCITTVRPIARVFRLILAPAVLVCSLRTLKQQDGAAKQGPRLHLSSFHDIPFPGPVCPIVPISMGLPQIINISICLPPCSCSSNSNYTLTAGY